MFYELKATVLLKQEVHYLHVPERIGSWISRSALNDPVLKQEHYSTGYKHIVYGNPYPREKNGIYKKDRVYVITIRSSLNETLQRIARSLHILQEDNYFQLLALSRIQTKNPKHILELVTVTPAIVTVDGKPWVPGGNIELLLSRIHANTEKKFNTMNPDQKVRLDHYFAHGVQVENSKPIALAYKGRKLLGNKIRLFIQEDPVSQQLAHTALGSGILEKNSVLGAGFCLAKELD